MRRQLLYEYDNNNVHVEIFSDGTKIRDVPDDEPANPTYPESIDLKITNYCDYECHYCHESSDRNGDHAELGKLAGYLAPLNPGTEIAIGGGDPLSIGKHRLIDFTKILSHNLNLIPNITIKWSPQIGKHLDWLTKLVDINQLYGIGVSGVVPLGQQMYDAYPSIVHHVIAGYHDIDTIEQLPKVLVLGYKFKGRSANLHPGLKKDVEDSLYEWYTHIPLYFKSNMMSFDNLAIEQLNMRRFFNDEQWQKLFMGMDGSYTFYVDGVNMEYAISSTHVDRYPLTNVKDDFQHVRHLAQLEREALRLSED